MDYEGVTVPNTSANRQAFYEGLRRVRRFITAVESERLIPDIPRDESICRGCHRGFPRVYRKGETDTELAGRKLPPYLTKGDDQRLYHGTCGDRFGWVPDHERAREKGLR